jgi:hypothetical protein
MQNGSLADRFLIGMGLYANGVSGGDQGFQTVNANQYYASGTLLPIQKKFTSSDQAITSGGTLTLAHGLGAAPVMVRLQLVAQGANDGYSTNDLIEYHAGPTAGAENRGINIVCDATNISVTFGSNANAIDVLNKSSGSVAAATNANYKLRVTAFA